MSMQLELKNADLRAGDELKIKGVILHDAERFQIDLGRDTNDLALHFNLHFHDNNDGAVLVYCVKKNKKQTGDMFEVELPDGQEVQFPNHVGMDVISYVRVTGDFKLTSFKIC
ncbi:galectin-2-like [Pholidichthys leucotaenia]